MNRIMLSGRLTKDPEIRVTSGETPITVASFGIAVDRKNKAKEADFFNCSAFGKTAEFMERYLMKGSRIMLSGRIQNDNYTDKEGRKVSAVKIIAEEVEFADGPKGQKTAAPAEPAEKKKEEWMPVDDFASDELPFKF